MFGHLLAVGGPLDLGDYREHDPGDVERHDRLIYAVVQPPDAQNSENEYERPGHTTEHHVGVPWRPYGQNRP